MCVCFFSVLLFYSLVLLLFLCVPFLFAFLNHSFLPLSHSFPLMYFSCLSLFLIYIFLSPVLIPSVTRSSHSSSCSFLSFFLLPLLPLVPLILPPAFLPTHTDFTPGSFKSHSGFSLAIQIFLSLALTLLSALTHNSYIFSTLNSSYIPGPTLTSDSTLSYDVIIWADLLLLTTAFLLYLESPCSF